jgi:hypothetical protein
MPFSMGPRVWVDLEGPQAQEALNRALARGLAVFSVRPTARGLTVCLPPSALPTLRRFARPGARVWVRHRRGWAYAGWALRRRPGLAAGALAFAGGLWALGSLVWAVQVEGVPARLRPNLPAALARAGLRPGVWRGSVHPLAAARLLQKALPSLAWAWVHLDGGRAVVQVVPELRPHSRHAGSFQLGQGVRQLVASHGGEVVRVQLTQGVALVHPGERVRAGQVLAEGYPAFGVSPTVSGPVPWAPPKGSVWVRYVVHTRGSAPLVRVTEGLGPWQVRVDAQVGGAHVHFGQKGPGGPALRPWVAVKTRLPILGEVALALRGGRPPLRKVTPLPRGPALAAAKDNARRALLLQVGSGARVVRQALGVTWQRHKVTVSLTAWVEANVARPDAKSSRIE